VPELQFSIDIATGELSLHIQGIAGQPATTLPDS